MCNDPELQESNVVDVSPMMKEIEDLKQRVERLEKVVEIIDKRILKQLGLEGFKSAWELYEEKR